MKKYFVLVALLFTSLPGFGSHGQPGASSQFHVNAPHGSPSKHKALAHRGTQGSSAPWKGAANPARKGRFVNRARGLGSVAGVNFIAGGRTAWGGQDDDESESVLGDFNGDGKMVSPALWSMRTATPRCRRC